MAAVDHDALPGRDGMLRPGERHAEPVAVGCDDGGDVLAAVPDPDLGLEGTGGGRRPGDPPRAVGDQSRAARAAPRGPTTTRFAGRQVHHVAPLPVATPSPRRCPIVNPNVPSCRRQHPPVRIDDRPRVHELGRAPAHERAGLAGGREAELLRVGLVGHRQAEAAARARASPPSACRRPGTASARSSRCPSMCSM